MIYNDLTDEQKLNYRAIDIITSEDHILSQRSKVVVKSDKRPCASCAERARLLKEKKLAKELAISQKTAILSALKVENDTTK